jgi:hypothetical protein
MGGKARLILQECVCGEVRVESGILKRGLGRLRGRYVLNSLVGEESRNLKVFLIGFQDFLGIVHFFFRYP